MTFKPKFPIEIHDNGQVVTINSPKEYDTFCRKFTLVHAAGGIVSNESNEILMIFRRGLWDFPKGKVEKGEQFEEAALREVQEETGAAGLRLLHPLADTFHTYLNGAPILKATHWFAMSCENTALKPQTEEDITKAEWIECGRTADLLEDSYPSLARLWQEIRHEFV